MISLIRKAIRNSQVRRDDYSKRKRLDDFLIGNSKHANTPYNRYLAEQTYMQEDVQNIAENPDYARDQIVERLTSLEHTSYLLPLAYPYTDEPKEVYKLSPRQLVRVHLLLNGLKDDRILTEIGRQMSEDISDEYSEHGGLITLGKDRSIKFNPVPSAFTLPIKTIIHYENGNPVSKTEIPAPKDKANNRRYLIDWRTLQEPHIAEYHFHTSGPTQEGYVHAGPSPDDIWYALEGSSRLFPSSGIGSRHHESHLVVITKLLEKGKFNVDYFGIDGLNKPENLIVLDIGDYHFAENK